MILVGSEEEAPEFILCSFTFYMYIFFLPTAFFRFVIWYNKIQKSGQFSQFSWLEIFTDKGVSK